MPGPGHKFPPIMDRCVRHVIASGKPESNAYAICRSQLGLAEDGSEDMKELSLTAEDLDKKLISAGYPMNPEATTEIKPMVEADPKVEKENYGGPGAQPQGLPKMAATDDESPDEEAAETPEEEAAEAEEAAAEAAKVAEKAKKIADKKRKKADKGKAAADAVGTGQDTGKESLPTGEKTKTDAPNPNKEGPGHAAQMELTPAGPGNEPQSGPQPAAAGAPQPVGIPPVQPIGGDARPVVSAEANKQPQGAGAFGSAQTIQTKVHEQEVSPGGEQKGPDLHQKMAPPKHPPIHGDETHRPEQPNLESVPEDRDPSLPDPNAITDYNEDEVDQPSEGAKVIDQDGAPEIAAGEKRKDVNPEEGKSKYGDVEFADPTNKKYPIDTEAHIRSAYSYINMPKNAEKYADKGAAIKKKVVAAWKKKIDPAGPPSAASEKSTSELLLETAKRLGKQWYEIPQIEAYLRPLAPSIVIGPVTRSWSK